MRKLNVIGILLALLPLGIFCGTRQKVEYNLPDHIPPDVRKLYMERLEKGRILYKKHCSDCHGIFSKGKDGITNFTKTQIDNYHTTALVGKDPKNHAVAKKLSQQQLDYIISFLQLRKPS